MSLTQPYKFSERKIKGIIRENIPNKNQFTSNDGTMCFDTKKECVVPYSLGNVHIASICGTAFDYLARFSIAQKVQNKNEVLYNLAAGLVFQKNTLWRNIENQKEAINTFYKSIVSEIKKFIISKEKLNDKLIEDCIFLAKLEHIYRSGTIITEKPCYLESDCMIKQELKKLILSFEKIFMPNVKKDSIVVFNPHFGIGSSIVGGADADIYIDGILYDFKVKKNNGWLSADVTQLLGYYFLDVFAKKCNDEKNYLSKYKIDKVALYKVRYEEIAYFNVNELGKNRVEMVEQEICYYYLMNNLSPKHIDKYSIPLTYRQLRYDCGDNGCEELEWYNNKKGDLSDYGKKRILEITESQRKLKEFFDSIDVFKLLKEVTHKSKYSSTDI